MGTTRLADETSPFIFTAVMIRMNHVPVTLRWWLVPFTPKAIHDGQLFRRTDKVANAIEMLIARQSFEVGIVARNPLLVARFVEVILHSRDAALNEDPLKVRPPSISSR
jgi:hypothetical protein